MSNGIGYQTGFSPSTVWGQLSMPIAPAGSIPFVNTDNITIFIDPLNFNYSQTLDNITITNGILVTHGDSTATPGAAIINNIAGRSKIAISASSVVISNTLAAVGDIVICTLETADTTLTRVIAVAGAGNITITGNATATAATTVAWFLLKVR